MSASIGGIVAPGESRRTSLLVAASLVLLAIVTAILPFVPFVRSFALSLVFVGSAVVVGAFRLRSGWIDWFELFFIVTALFFVYFGVGTIYLLIYPRELPSISLLPYLEPALALCVLGYLAFTLGYLTMFRKPSPSPTRWLRPKDSRAIFVLGAIGTLGATGWVLQVHLGASRRIVSSVFSLFQQFLPVFFLAWALAWMVFWRRREHRWRAAIPVVILGCATVVWLFFSVGGKGLAIMLLSIPAIAYTYARRRLPVKTIIAVVLLSIFVIFPIYNTFRWVGRDLGTAERLNRTLTVARKWDNRDYAQYSLWAFLRRVGVVTSVAAIIRDTGRWVEFRYGETLFLAPVSLFIPRFLWPEKPNIAIGREFGERFGLVAPGDEETMIAATVVGDFYWNFHLPGVIAGMFLLGAGYRWIYRRYGEGSRGEPVRTAVYIALLCGLIGVEGNIAVLLAATVKTVVAFGVILWVLHRAGLIETVSPDELEAEGSGA